MAIFCIPQNWIQKIKDTAVAGEFDIRKLYEMSSKERNEYFTKATDAEIGKFLNVQFEKAMISKQQGALTDWAKSVFEGKPKQAAAYKTVLDKIKTLDEMGVLSPKSEDAFLSDLVSDKLGVTVTSAEVKAIAEKAKKIQELQEKVGEDLGLPGAAEASLEFLKAKKEMDDYLQEHSPASLPSIVTGTIGRLTLLASVKSPVLNVISNIEIGLTEALSRRVASGKFKGADDKLAVDYIKNAIKTYKETGYDMSRMTSMKDMGASGERVLGESVHSKGPGKIRRVGRFYEDVVGKYALGLPDATSAALHFADSVNLGSMKMLKGDKVKAREAMEDAMRIEPKTPEGEILRAQGILDAQVATWTNKSRAAEISERMRTVINDASGGLRFGDQFTPFVKTPANVISTSMDYAGLGVPKAMLEVMRMKQSGEWGNHESMQKITRNLVRSGFGLAASLFIVSQLSDDDYVGAYDPQRAQITALRNSGTNAVRLPGTDRWVSTDYLGPLSVAVSAMMYARKYGGGPGETAFQTGKGVATELAKLPPVRFILDTANAYNEAPKYQSSGEMTTAFSNYLSGQIYARLVPSLVSDFAKAFDPYERKTTKSASDQIKAKIPGVRQTLPVKKNVFGEEIKGTTPVEEILFGARVKADKSTPLIEEISRVQQANAKALTFSDWERTQTKTLAQFKEKVGPEKYEAATADYGKALKAELERITKSPKYKKLSDEEKLTVLNGADTVAQNKVFTKYHFKYKKDAPKKKLGI